MRCFVAMGVDDAIRARLEIVVGRLRRAAEAAVVAGTEAAIAAGATKAATAAGKKITWTRPSGWHVTLKFLGEVADDRLAAVRASLSAAIAGFERFEMTLTGIYGFPTGRAPRALVVGVCDGGRSTKLAERIDASLASLGFEREARPYVAHVTLARLRDRVAARTIGGAIKMTAPLSEQDAAAFGTATVERIGLYESRLERDGAHYTELEHFALEPAA